MRNETRQHRPDAIMKDSAQVRTADRVPGTDFMPRLEGHMPQPAVSPRVRRPPWRALLVAAILVLRVGWGVKTALLPKPADNLVTAPVTIGDIDRTVLATGTLKPA